MTKNYDARTLLAFGITLASVIGISVLALVIVITGDADGKAQGVLNAVLPLFGTWVGTVLAYYFSRENFESAAANTERLVRQLTPEEVLRSTPVTAVMVKEIFSVQDQSMRVQDLLDELDKKDYKRLPIVTDARVIQALLYREDLRAYLLSVSEAARAQGSKTIKDVLDERPELDKPRGFVSERATLSTARDEMERIDKCQVVFVSKTGRSDEPILGMLTNTDIARHARV